MASSIINSDDGTVSGTPGISTSGGSDGELAFQSSGTEVMRIDSSGRVGIGTSSPSYALDVNGGTNNIVSRFTSTDAASLIGFEDSSTTTDNVYIGAIGNDLYAYGSGSVYLQSGGSDSLILDGSSNLKFNSGYGSVATAYGCRAWVNFNGTGTVAIRESGNVSSITDNGTGDYTVNFTTAMPDANYCVVGAAGQGNTNACPLTSMARNQAPSASSCRVSTGNSNLSITDREYVCISIFR